MSLISGLQAATIASKTTNLPIFFIWIKFNIYY